MNPAVLVASALAYLLLVAVLPASWLSDAGAGLLSLCLQGLPVVTSESIWTAWSFAPAVAIPLAAWAVGHGVRLNRRGQLGLAKKKSALAACGFLLLGLAVLSPLCRLAANLAWVHMVQHVLLVALAPPLLVLGTRVVEASNREDLPHRFIITNPGRCAAIYGLLIWLWHVPRFYEAALLDPRVHLLMYGSLIASAMLFWTSILSARRARATHAPWAIVALLITFVHTGLLGALLLFSPRLWYPLLAGTGASWGYPPLADQQLAGLIMWVPMGAIYLLAALWVASGALASAGARSMRTRADGHDALIE